MTLAKDFKDTIQACAQRDPALFDWPGKSDKEGNERPAVLHMLDVAACAEQLIHKHTAFAHLSSAQRQALIILSALHDVGKLSESFRALIREKETGNPLHWQLSDFLLCGVLDPVLDLGSDLYSRFELYAATAGHHGRAPARNHQQRREGRKYQRAIGVGEEAVKLWGSKLLELFPDSSLENMNKEEATTMSWLLSGLTVAADWIGSNTDWFPVQGRDDPDIQMALEESRQTARRAVAESGVIPPPVAPLDPYTPLGMTLLRPMQQAAMTVDLHATPELIIVEDSTGTGKTEAALILAQRMIEKGKGQGIFFALPTCSPCIRG